MNISIFETLEHYLLAHEVGLVRAGMNLYVITIIRDIKIHTQDLRLACFRQLAARGSQ